MFAVQGPSIKTGFVIEPNSISTSLIENVRKTLPDVLINIPVTIVPSPGVKGSNAIDAGNAVTTVRAVESADRLADKVARDPEVTV